MQIIHAGAQPFIGPIPAADTQAFLNAVITAFNRAIAAGFTTAENIATFEDFGVVNDGRDNTVNLQAAFTESAAAGLTLYGYDGVYLVTSALRVPSGLKLVMSPMCVLLRGYTQTGTTGLLMNADMLVKVSKVQISGGCIKNADTAGFQGNQICLNADDSVVENIFLDEWGTTSRAILWAGDRNIMRNIRAVSAGLGGGIRIIGGDSNTCSDSYVECGDDCYNFVPGGGTTGLLQNLSITNSNFINCVGKSTFARLFLAALSGSGVLHMTCDILRCGFIGVRGFAANRGMIIYNEDSTGVVGDIDIIGCSIDMSADVTSGNAAFIKGSVGSGGVQDVRVFGFTMKNPFKECMEISGVVDRITWDGFRLEAPRAPTSVTLDLKDVKEASFKNGYFGIGLVAGLQIGTGGLTASNVTVENCTFDLINDNRSGVLVVTGNNVKIERCRFTKDPVATTPRGIQFNAGAVDCETLNNDYTSLGPTQSLFFSGAVVRPRISERVSVYPQTTNISLLPQHNDWTFTNEGAAGLVQFTLPTVLTVGRRYTFVVQAAQTIRIKAGTGSTITTNAGTSADAGRADDAVVGSVIIVQAVSLTQWVAISQRGTWAVT